MASVWLHYEAKRHAPFWVSLLSVWHTGPAPLYAFTVGDFMPSTLKYFLLLCWQAFPDSSQLFSLSLSASSVCCRGNELLPPPHRIRVAPARSYAFRIPTRAGCLNFMYVVVSVLQIRWLLIASVPHGVTSEKTTIDMRIHTVLEVEK
jgi:hypothetical protein